MRRRFADYLFNREPMAWIWTTRQSAQRTQQLSRHPHRHGPGLERCQECANDLALSITTKQGSQLSHHRFMNSEDSKLT
jgi:hypothetical protein